MDGELVEKTLASKSAKGEWTVLAIDKFYSRN